VEVCYFLFSGSKSQQARPKTQLQDLSMLFCKTRGPYLQMSRWIQMETSDASNSVICSTVSQLNPQQPLLQKRTGAMATF
jgi:hypothetical protein